MKLTRTQRTIMAAALALAVIGYKRAHDDDGKDAPHEPAAHGAAEPAPARMLGRIAFHPCTLAPQFGQMSVEAQCGTLSVAENPAAPQGRRIALNIAWVPADDQGDLQPDPVFMIAGGPGQASTESYPQVAPAFADVLKKRHVLLVDQRGTGKSNPLRCSDDAAGEDDSAAVHDSIAAARTAAERCRDALSKQADLRFYTTTDAIRDLDAVRVAIGADKINLMGVSYGTRVAQQYAMRYPQHTRSIVLDSVAPNAIHLGNDFARNLESALDLQFGRCGKEASCAAKLGDPRQRLDALMAKLRSNPPRVRYRDAGTGEMQEEVLQPGHVAGLTRMYAYAPLAAAILPLQLKEASEGRYEGLMALAKMLGSSVSDQMMYGMQLSVICSEDADGLRGDDAMSGSLLGNMLVDTIKAQCEVWPKGVRPADFHKPLATKVPALLLSGELDPVTPPVYGEEVAKGLGNARHLVLRGQGHGAMAVGCTPKLISQFIETLEPKKLDAHCLDSLTYVPPFTSFNGWEP
jgi:pimeloyl-ACP methyl ester carboxylesterase